MYTKEFRTTGIQWKLKFEFLEENIHGANRNNIFSIEVTLQKSFYHLVAQRVTENAPGVLWQFLIIQTLNKQLYFSNMA